MAAQNKLTADTAEAICEFARQGLPVGRAAALVGVHRVTAQRWMREGAAEIAEAADGDDELGPRAAFALSFDAARAEFLLGLSASWQAAIKRKDANVAKAVQVRMASASPDEFSERRVIRTVDQTTTLAGQISVSRFDAMTDDELHAEREKIAARRDAAQAGAAGDDWQAAAVRMPGQDKDEDQPERAAEEKTSTVENPKRSVSTRKPGTATKGSGDGGLAQKISPTRARNSNASVVDGPSDVQTDGTAPEHGEGGVSFAGAPPSPPFPTSADDDEDTKL